jgi:hypothetical protein
MRFQSYRYWLFHARHFLSVAYCQFVRFNHSVLDVESGIFVPFNQRIGMCASKTQCVVGVR